MAIGAGLVAVGSWITAGAATGVMAGVIGGAIVGAAIGGLTAAITGGDILQGVLFGAIGGAITGGFAGYAAAGAGAAGAGGGTTVTTAAGNTVTTVGGSANASLQAAEAAMLGGNAGGGVASATIGQTLTQLGTSMVSQYGGDFVKGIAASYMDGKKADVAHEQALEEINLRHKNAMEMASTGGGGGGGSSVPDHAIQLKEMDINQRNLELDEQTRKYELDRSDRLQSEEEIKEARAGRKALFSVRQQGSEARQVENKGSIQEMRQNEQLAAGGKQIVGNEQSALAPMNPDEEQEGV